MIPPQVRPLPTPLPLRQRRVLLRARLAHLQQRTQQQALSGRTQQCQRRYLPTYLKAVLLHFRTSLIHSLRHSTRR
ncbi:MAG: hypothetical protein Q6L58_06905 [Thermostichales cyanobacterium BF3_bins_165]